MKIYKIFYTFPTFPTIPDVPLFSQSIKILFYFTMLQKFFREHSRPFPKREKNNKIYKKYNKFKMFRFLLPLGVWVGYKEYIYNILL